MALTYVFDLSGMTSQQYEEVLKGLAAAKATAPAGRLYHVASPKPGGWFVVDVWESQELFDRFAQTLVPLLQKAGVSGAPQVYQVHNIILPAAKKAAAKKAVKKASKKRR